jgi:hypothetical protein
MKSRFFSNDVWLLLRENAKGAVGAERGEQLEFDSNQRRFIYFSMRRGMSGEREFWGTFSSRLHFSEKDFRSILRQVNELESKWTNMHFPIQPNSSHGFFISHWDSDY